MELASFRDVIDLWPTRAALVRDLKDHGGATTDAPVYDWHHEDRIAEKWFDPLIAAAKHRGFEGVTYAALARLYRRQTT